MFVGMKEETRAPLVKIYQHPHKWNILLQPPLALSQKMLFGDIAQAASHSLQIIHNSSDSTARSRRLHSTQNIKKMIMLNI